MFGTSGIRGLYGKDVTGELALRMANAFAEGDVAIGRDTRRTGPLIFHAACSGVLARGHDALDLGIVPTPTVALATRKHKCLGIMLTASHNPEEYNGLKFIADAIEISREWERKLEREYAKGMRAAEWSGLGKMRADAGIVADHMAFVTSLVDAGTIGRKKPKVVVDSNGAGAVITPGLLRTLGCEVVSINDSLEGFARVSEPNAANLAGLGAKVREAKADLGIGHDGDADRAVAVDEKGAVLPLDVQLAMMIANEMGDAGKGGKKIISTMEASLTVREAVEEAGGEIAITPVGSLHVAETLREEGALFGGEPCGEYIFRKGLHVPDGVLTAAKIVEIFARGGKLSVMAAKYRGYPMAREKFPCERKYEAVEALRDGLRALVKGDGRISEEDGVRVDEGDGWFLVRASGTEPFVRLTMEYRDAKKLDRMKGKLSEMIGKEIGKKG